MSETTVNNNGIGVLGLLGVVFITLKLCGVITWSWWWFTCPFWGGIGIVCAALLLCFAFLGIYLVADLIIGVFKK